MRQGDYYSSLMEEIALWWLQNSLFIADIISNMWLWRIWGMGSLRQ